MSEPTVWQLWLFIVITVTAAIAAGIPAALGIRWAADRPSEWAAVVAIAVLLFVYLPGVCIGMAWLITGPLHAWLGIE